MPTYEFRCPKCLITCEVIASVSEQSAPTCSCGELMTKIFSAPGIVFKGDGWAGKS